MIRFWILPLILWSIMPLSAHATKATDWQITPAEALSPIDDDIRRNIGTPGFFDGIEISERRFVENGFAWHLIRFASKERPVGPLWMVPHDDENASFDAMISAVKLHGGVGLAVNTGPGGVRRQTGQGMCGLKLSIVESCDPNRNFGQKSPIFTSAFLSERVDQLPIIALHTNSPGFSGDRRGGHGDITILDAAAFGRGEKAPRSGGYLAINPSPEMANFDTLGLAAYLSSNGKPDAAAVACRNELTHAGIHFWHERVGAGDGSMSNYLAINRPDISYFNAESRAETDLTVSSARHAIIISAYLALCFKPKT